MIEFDDILVNTFTAVITAVLAYSLLVFLSLPKILHTLINGCL